MASVSFRRRKPQVAEKSGYLYVQVIHRRVTRTLALPFRVYEEEWDNKQNCIVFPPDCSEERLEVLTEIRRRLAKDIRIWEDIVARLERKNDYTSADVISEYKRRRNRSLLTSMAAFKIQQLRKKGALSTACNYLGVVKRFLAFTGNRQFRMQDITKETLIVFAAHLHSRGLCRNTISFYFRILRALWNLSMHEGIIPMQPSPFHVVFTGMEKTAKRAVREEIINRLTLLSGLSDNLGFARDLFLFCFYARGMSFVDLAHLTRDNIKGEYLVYTRRKCGTELNIRLLPCMLLLLERYKNNGTPYLFPILKSANPSYREYESALRVQNKRLKKLAALIDKPHLKLTTYVARHSWASIANEKGVSIEIISRALGHTSVETTYIYVTHLDNQVVDNANEWVVMGSQMDEKLFTYD